MKIKENTWYLTKSGSAIRMVIVNGKYVGGNLKVYDENGVCDTHLEEDIVDLYVWEESEDVLSNKDIEAFINGSSGLSSLIVPSDQYSFGVRQVIELIRKINEERSKQIRGQ